MSDPASLQNLHDVVLPAPVAAWPPAPGWYVAAAIVAGLLAVLAWRGWRYWRRNRYRGQALRELERIRQGAPGAVAGDLPALLKRAALSAWPREHVAGLTGAGWHRFLDESAGMDRFGCEAGALLDRLAFPSRAGGALSTNEEAIVLEAAGDWLRRHRAPRESR